LVFIILAISGAALYIKPEGDIANWVDWRFLGLHKSDWEGIHAVFSLIFLAVSLVHVFYFNGRALIRYSMNTNIKKITIKPEFFAAGLLVLVLFLAALFQWQPLWKIARMRQVLKNNESWIKQPAPSYDFYKKNIAEIANYLKISADQVMQILNQYHWQVDSAKDTLQEIAVRNRISPEKIYIYILDYLKKAGNQ
jgi:preprotein translocase subunit Sec61beta